MPTGKIYLGSTLISDPAAGGGLPSYIETYTWDSDAAAYLTSVATADSQDIELGVAVAINNFVLGLKADGLWSLIDACCIMAGARTVAGALVPLKGSAPTNNGFVSGDYNRKTGLLGNGSSKYLNSNYGANTRGLEDRHAVVWLGQAWTPSGTGYRNLFGSTSNVSGAWTFYRDDSGSGVVGETGLSGNFDTVSLTSYAADYHGLTTTTTANRQEWRYGSTTRTANGTYIADTDDNDFFVFADNNVGTPRFYANARVAFYSFGGELNSGTYRARILTLTAALAASIP